MLQDEIEQPDKLKFFDDLTSICKDFPESKFTLLIHDDILTRQKDEGFSKGPLGRRLTMVITLLIAHGRTSVVKGVRGEENRGWRRSPLGGNHGNHFYLWWAPCKAPPVMGINVSDNTIFLRAVRHHDDHSHLNSGELSDFHLINTHDLTKDTDFKLPWTQEQRSFIHALSPIRILRGQPGSGKTVSLWQSIQLRPDENVLYLTWSSRLADLAREYFETFASLGSSFRVVIFTDLLHELAGKTPQALAIEEGRRIFLEAISKLSPAQLGPWANYSSTLYSEVRAHYVGAFLPIINGYATNKIDSTIQIKDYQLRRAGYLGKSIEGVISSIKAIEGRALIGSCFPDLALAWEACEKLTSDLAVTTKDLIINRIVLDEVQDLTPIEALAFILLARKIGEKNNGAAPFLLITGDEGQTVRPTDFEWPWLKNLISKVLRPPEDLSLISNLRNPSKINRFVCAISDLYESLPKQDRPRGQEHIDEEEGTIGELIYCETADNTSLTNLITKLTNLTYLFISLSEPPPKFLKGENTSECLSVFEAKGLEFQRVCVVNPGCFLGSILKSEHDEVVLGEVKRIWKRSNIDHIRVAASRATETLILLDVDAKEKDNKHLKKILEDNDVLTLSPEELLKYLDRDDHDLESKMQMFLETARSLIDIRPELALQRARQAAHLFEVNGSMAKSGDVNLRNDVYLMIMRSILQCIAISARSKSEHNTLLREAYESSMKCEIASVSQVILGFIDFQNEQDGSKKFSLFVKLIENKTNVPVNDRWAMNGFNRLYADLKGSLLEFAVDVKYCDEISENLNNYFNAIGVPKENIEQESNDILLRVAKNLVSIGSFQKAMATAKLIYPEPKELLAVCQESIEAKSLQDKELQKKQLVAPFSEATAKEMQKEIAINLQKEVEEKEDLGNGIKLEMVLIPAGKFMMGSPADEKGHSRDETQHEVTLTKPFYIGKYEVTQEQWEAVMGYNRSKIKGSTLPVTDISWEDCQKFIEKLNAKTKGGYRLPTEAEWEFACRAGTTTAYSFGDEITPKDANYDVKSLKPVAVGSYKANPFGLYDMHGNVWEWCEDEYVADAVTDPKIDPKCLVTVAGESRVLRGGTSLFFGDESGPRSSYKIGGFPFLHNNFNFGFRLARSADSKSPVAPTVPKPDPVEVLPALGNLLVAPFSEATAKEMQKEIAENLQKELEEKEDLGKGVKLDMVLIPAGKFMMGSPANEMGRESRDDDETQHEVTLTKPYYMGKYEVTQEQYEAVMGNNPSSIKGAKLPVTNVSWQDCKGFIKNLNAKTNGGYRLPTEAEWEYACRAGTTTAYSVGDKITPNDANYNDSKIDKPVTVGKNDFWLNDPNYKGKPVTVGNYIANPFGLYDMHGNVSEWCEDWKASYPAGAVSDPKGPATGAYRVLRGGAFDDFGVFIRSSSRVIFGPPGRYPYGGFRLARTIEFRKESGQLKIERGQTDLVLSNNVEKLGRPYTEIEAKAAQDETSKNLGIDVHLKVNIKKEINFEFMLIPAGLFLMGSKDSEIGRYSNETQHEVLITTPYYIGMYVVTQEQWKSVMGNNPSKRKNKKFPVTNVSWRDCQNFIKKLSNLTGDNYRLPTEAEWEYSAKAGVVSAYTSGETLSNNDANYNYNISTLRSVGSYRPNAFGLYDVQGNVWELCQDRYAEDYHLSSREDPQGGLVGEGVVTRGGGYGNPENQVRLSVRNGVLANYRDESIGFRLVKTIPSAITPSALVKPIGFSAEVPETGALALEESTGTLIPPYDSEQKASKSEKDLSSNAFSDYRLADSIFNLGCKSYDQKKYAEAIDLYTKAIELKPKFAEAYNGRGMAYDEMIMYLEAVADYTKAIEINPMFKDFYFNRGYTYDNLHKYTEAIADYTKVIAINPMDTGAYFNRGYTYSNLHNYSEAIEDFTKAIELDVKFVRPYNNRGNAYQGLEKYPEALADYTKAIELDPKYAEAYNNRGTAYGALIMYPEAIADFTKGIELDPKDAVAYYNRGKAYSNLKKYEEAIADYTKAIELDHKYVNAYINRGFMYYNLQKYTEAIADYTEAIKLDPNDVVACTNRGDAHKALGKTKEAEADFAKAKELEK